MALSAKGIKAAATELEELMANVPARKMATEFERLLEKQFRGAKDDAQRVMDEIIRRVNSGAKKPKLPAPSKPEPKLTREPKRAPKPKPEPLPKPDPSRVRKSGKKTTTKEPGILTLQNAINAVRAILASGQAKALSIASMIPFVGTAVGVTELVRGVPDDEAIIELMRKAVLQMKNKRAREKLDPSEWGRYPNGTPKRDIMRRVPSEFGDPVKAIPAAKEPKPKKPSDSTPLT